MYTTMNCIRSGINVSRGHIPGRFGRGLGSVLASLTPLPPPSTYAPSLPRQTSHNRYNHVKDNMGHCMHIGTRTYLSSQAPFPSLKQLCTQNVMANMQGYPLTFLVDHCHIMEKILGWEAWIASVRSLRGKQFYKDDRDWLRRMTSARLWAIRPFFEAAGMDIERLLRLGVQSTLDVKMLAKDPLIPRRLQAAREKYPDRPYYQIAQAAIATGLKLNHAYLVAKETKEARVLKRIESVARATSTKGKPIKRKGVGVGGGTGLGATRSRILANSKRLKR